MEDFVDLVFFSPKGNLTRKPRFDKKLKFGKCSVYLTRFPMEYCVSKRDKNIFMYLQNRKYTKTEKHFPFISTV
jgi:hypothetical protein